MSEENVRLHVMIKGIVQGVGFRFFVWNRINGAVEVLAEGQRPKLEKFLELISQGPSHAQVEKTEVKWLEAQSDLPPFTVRMDA